jgi:hypothetical protein
LPRQGSQQKLLARDRDRVGVQTKPVRVLLGRLRKQRPEDHDASLAQLEYPYVGLVAVGSLSPGLSSLRRIDGSDRLSSDLFPRGPIDRPDGGLRPWTVNLLLVVIVLGLV